MKINSNTLSFTKENDDFKTLETIISKVASENNITDVESVEIILSKDSGLVGFKVAQPVLEDKPQSPTVQPPIQQQPAQTAPLEQAEEQSVTQPTQEIGQEQPTETEQVVEKPSEEQTAETLLKDTGEPITPEEAQKQLAGMQKQYEEMLANQAQQGDPSWFGEFDELVNKVTQQKQEGQQAL